MDFNVLRKQISSGGQVVTADDAEYETARGIWNAAISKHPKVVVYCKGVADVKAALKFAGQNRLPISVRGGGHSFSGRSVIDDGLVLDVSRMNGVRVNATKQTAWVEGGCRWGQVDRETTVHGLATVGGTVSDTGVGGLSQGGGFGFLTRMHGLVVDNIIAADVVLADGRFVRASVKENPDLLWGIRGGGGNFGVVTAFKFRLHKLPEQTYGGFEVFPWSHAKVLLQYLYDTYPTRDRHTTLIPLLACPPPLGFQPAVVMVVAHFGPKEDLDKVLNGIHNVIAPLMSTVGPSAYTEIQTIIDHFAPPKQHLYATSQFLKLPLSTTLVDDIVSTYEQRSNPGCVFVMEMFGEALLEQPNDATCFGHRDRVSTQYVAWTMTPTADGYDKGCEWIKLLKEKMSPHQHADSFYANYAIDGVAADQQARWAFGNSLPKLLDVKRNYDPENVFRANINIKSTPA